MASEPDSNAHTNSQNASMAPHPNPPSIEAAYKRKCIALKKRLNEVEAHNDAMRLRNAQGIRYIQKMRLESCMMLERLSVLMGMADGSGRQVESEVTGRAMALVKESGHLLDEERSRSGQKRTGEDLDALGEESDGSSGHHPPTPQERPLRPKRNRKSDERPSGDNINTNDAGHSNNNTDSVSSAFPISYYPLFISPTSSRHQPPILPPPQPMATSCCRGPLLPHTPRHTPIPYPHLSPHSVPGYSLYNPPYIPGRPGATEYYHNRPGHLPVTMNTYIPTKSPPRSASFHQNNNPAPTTQQHTPFYRPTDSQIMQVDHHHTSSANPSASELSSFPPANSGREPPHRYVSAFDAFTNHKRASVAEALVRSYGQRVTDEDIDRALVKEWDALDPTKKREFGERLEKENGV
ncbi:hypothetical protein MGYG_02478 [Nannizzia gypsea CBS 118893]|uniref:HMG box domain-containing protein n=1 Tax=Arthroderma gypseum (strain ATCC MYA-4604 / CBS 118893) TaxID=535722 RepID=E4UMQ0_ARTGP|nr:hypothetical protein MGYG_02478 [Nannizzia gypsea CBS 118893]EFQ99467.1 hypothetical protein MGYG_02478 [Nannizzia gypsea CBS 118893]